MCWVVLCVWIGCTGVRYCVLGGGVCVDWLYWGQVCVFCGVVGVDWLYWYKVLCVVWWCVWNITEL